MIASTNDTALNGIDMNEIDTNDSSNAGVSP